MGPLERSHVFFTSDLSLRFVNPFRYERILIPTIIFVILLKDKDKKESRTTNWICVTPKPFIIVSSFYNRSSKTEFLTFSLEVPWFFSTSVVLLFPLVPRQDILIHI